LFTVFNFVDGFAEIARCFGQSCNAKAIRNFFDRTVKPDVNLILDTLDAGGNPEDVMLDGIFKIATGKSQSQNV
jgi:hypothetical protein